MQTNSIEVLTNLLTNTSGKGPVCSLLDEPGSMATVNMRRDYLPLQDPSDTQNCKISGLWTLKFFGSICCQARLKRGRQCLTSSLAATFISRAFSSRVHLGRPPLTPDEIKLGPLPVPWRSMLLPQKIGFLSISCRDFSLVTIWFCRLHTIFVLLLKQLGRQSSNGGSNCWDENYEFGGETRWRRRL